MEHEEEEEKEETYYEELVGRAGNWELNQKPRPFHQLGKLLLAVLYNVICWVSALGLIWCGIQFLKTENRDWMVHALGFLVAFIISLVARYSQGVATHCPLCHGTPFYEKRCLKHRRANKFLFFSHRASTVLSILTRGRFNCMYCGTPFRIKK